MARATLTLSATRLNRAAVENAVRRLTSLEGVHVAIAAKRGVISTPLTVTLAGPQQRIDAVVAALEGLDGGIEGTDPLGYRGYTG